MSKKTHRLIKTPRISDSKLADYMASSEQARRSILQKSKYQPIAAVIQHIAARGMIAESIKNGKVDHATLKQKLEIYEGKITDSEFEESVKKHNIDYVNNVLNMGISECGGTEFNKCMESKKFQFNGTEVSFWPDLRVARTNKRNNRKIGAIDLRYSKSSPLSEKAASFHSALIFGILKDAPFEEFATPELELCQTVDARGGHVYPAPTNSIYRFKEMMAVCGSIAAQWQNIEPPSGAVL